MPLSTTRQFTVTTMILSVLVAAPASGPSCSSNRQERCNSGAAHGQVLNQVPGSRDFQQCRRAEPASGRSAHVQGIKLDQPHSRVAFGFIFLVWWLNLALASPSQLLREAAAAVPVANEVLARPS